MSPDEKRTTPLRKSSFAELRASATCVVGGFAVCAFDTETRPKQRIRFRRTGRAGRLSCTGRLRNATPADRYHCEDAGEERVPEPALSRARHRASYGRRAIGSVVRG